jgi:hypothetical protein
MRPADPRYGGMMMTMVVVVVVMIFQIMFFIFCDKCFP